MSRRYTPKQWVRMHLKAPDLASRLFHKLEFRQKKLRNSERVLLGYRKEDPSPDTVPFVPWPFCWSMS